MSCLAAWMDRMDYDAVVLRESGTGSVDWVVGIPTFEETSVFHFVPRYSTIKSVY